MLPPPLQANLERHLSRAGGADARDSLSSSEEDEDSGPDDGRGGGTSDLLERVFSGYAIGQSGGASDARTREAVLACASSGRASCLVCLSGIKKQVNMMTEIQRYY